jgi:hypothetical protein
MYMYSSRRRQPSEKDALLSLRVPLLTCNLGYKLQKPSGGSEPVPAPALPSLCRSRDKPAPAFFTRMGTQLLCKDVVVHQQGE